MCPSWPCFNKVDRVEDASDVSDLLARHEGSVAISAATGEGVDKLLDVSATGLRWLDRPRRAAHPLRAG